MLSVSTMMPLAFRSQPHQGLCTAMSICYLTFISDFNLFFTFLLLIFRDGAANEELIEFISHVLGVKSRCVTLDVGSKSRNKVLNVNINKTAEDVLQLLKASIDN